jgi:hypothetical protein
MKININELRLLSLQQELRDFLEEKDVDKYIIKVDAANQTLRLDVHLDKSYVMIDTDTLHFCYPEEKTSTPTPTESKQNV